MTRYEAARARLGDCPIEAGFMFELADHECRHGNLASLRYPHPTCGCWVDGVKIVPKPAPKLTLPPAPPKRRIFFPRRQRQSMRSVLARMMKDLSA